MKRTFHYCDVCGVELNPLVNWKTPLDLDLCDNCDLKSVGLGSFAIRDMAAKAAPGTTIRQAISSQAREAHRKRQQKYQGKNK